MVGLYERQLTKLRVAFGPGHSGVDGAMRLLGAPAVMAWIQRERLAPRSIWGKLWLWDATRSCFGFVRSHSDYAHVVRLSELECEDNHRADESGRGMGGDGTNPNIESYGTLKIEP